MKSFLKKYKITEETVELLNSYTNYLHIIIDVWEATSGTSADVPGVGLEMVSVLNW